MPIYRSFQGVLTQLRLWPGVEVAEVAGKQNASLAPIRGDGFEIDWVRQRFGVSFFLVCTICGAVALRDTVFVFSLKPFEKKKDDAQYLCRSSVPCINTGEVSKLLLLRSESYK